MFRFNSSAREAFEFFFFFLSPPTRLTSVVLPELFTHVPVNLLLTAVLSLFLKMQRYHRMLGVVRVVICWQIFSAAHPWLLHKAAEGNRTSCQLNRWVGMPCFAVREPIQG